VIRARRRRGKADGRIEQAIQHVRLRETGRAARDGAQAVAREVDHRAVGVTGSEASRLRHVGGGKEIDFGPGFDLLAHESGRAEFRCCDRVGARRKAPDEIREGSSEAAGSGHAQRVRRRRRRKRNQADQAAGKQVTHHPLRSSISL